MSKKIKKYLLIGLLLFTGLTADNRASLYIAPQIQKYQALQHQYAPVFEKQVEHQMAVAREGKQLKVHLTCYWAHGSGTDAWSEKKESTTGTRLRSGVSAAVDPRVIPFYSKIKIPGGPTLVAHDTGTDVINRKASHGKLPIVDVFFNTEREAMFFAENTPEVVTVTVIN